MHYAPGAKTVATDAPPFVAPDERAWVEVDAGALRRNLERVRNAVPAHAKLIPVVKSDAYGIGVRGAVATLRPARPFGFGVAAVEEGVELRRMGVREPVLILGPVPPATLASAVRAGLVPCVSDLPALAALREAATGVRSPVPFQIEVDTGMGRAGFFLEERSGWWDAVATAARSNLRLFGVFTHLHSADEPDLTSARRQIERFDDFVAWVRQAPEAQEDLLVHCSNSAGALRLRSSAENAVRPGIFLYGGCSFDAPVRPEPVVAVRGRIALVREAPLDATVGYGATYRARGPERWATVAVGYGDGLPRSLGNKGVALVAGGVARIVGRISMNATVLRLGRDVPSTTAAGDFVTFMGCDSGSEISLERIAKAANAIGYEILTRLSPRLPRIWLES